MKANLYSVFKTYNFSDCREITGDELYKINGGAQIENSNEAVANAQVGDSLTRKDGTVVEITQGDIDWAREQVGASSGGNTGATGEKSAASGDGGTTSLPVTVESDSGSSGLGSSSGNSSYSSNQNEVSTEKDNAQNIIEQNYVEDFFSGDEHSPNSKPLYKIPEIKNDSSQKLKNTNEKNMSKEIAGYEITFDSIEAAAKDFGLRYNDDSIRDNVEIATYIRKAGDKYYYDIPVGGGAKNVTLKRNINEKNIVAQVHTHGRYVEHIDDFTTTALEPSIGDYETMKKSGIPFFTFTPDGNMYYSGIDGERFQYPPVYPSDPFCPMRLNSINAYDLTNDYYKKQGGL